MKIKPIDGEPFRFWVQSESELDYHLVDLEEYEGNGECSCKDFKCRCLLRLEETGVMKDYGYRNNPDSARSRCKHIFVARTYCLDQIIQNN